MAPVQATAAPGARRARPGVLKVAVTTDIARFHENSGVGRVWNRTLRRLSSRRVDIDLVRPGSLRSTWRRPDVWLYDGHLGPIDVSTPTVAVLQEAPWHEEHLRGMLSPAWLDLLGPPSDAAADAATRVLVPSASSAGQLVRSGVDRSKIDVVAYGVDPLVFRPTLRAAGADFVRRRGCTSPYVLLVATVHPRKNIASLRVAMARLADGGRPHSLVMVLGGSPDATDGTRVEDEARAELDGHPGRVFVFEGCAEYQIAAMMSAASAYCQPSLMEGFGMTVLEAMACGAPVVVADRGSLPEVVGDAGVITEPDPQGLVAGLASVLDDGTRARVLADRGRRRSRAFTWEATAAGWRSALEEAASSR
jgi:glycosyltransferase involved in cell wall biosynthesis